MTDVVHIASSRNNINAMFQDSLRSDRAFRRQGHKKWKLSWQNGKLINTANGEEILAYHFVDSKSNPEFLVKLGTQNIRDFNISNMEIDCTNYENKGK